MKKSIFLAALVLISAGCFAQKANVSKARSLADAETPDYAGARAAIAEALQNDETKDQANTWYVAGFIGYKEFDNGNIKRQIGQNVDINSWGAAVYESLDYWTKAYDMAMVPTYDKKGRAKYDTRTPKSILPKVVEYFQFQPLIAAGFTAYENNNPSLAYDMFIAHCNIPEMKMMQDNPEEAAKLLRDSSFYTCLYYAGRFAYEAERYDEAVATLKRMNSEHANANALRKEIIYANEYIYQIYMEQKDTVAAVDFIKGCIDLFPEEPWFMQNLINLYINSGQEEKAIEYLDIAIAREPNVGQYYNSKGSILARVGRFDESFKAFEQAIAIEPNNALFLETLGFAYVDLGNKLNDDAAYYDAKEYAKAKVEIDKAFQNALPYFEKAYELEPDNYDYKRSLRSLYYRLGMNDKYEALAD
ncbi:MAG: tetratricopeptide repeat protein [Paludibacteraceae bacterium]|nr:tetratricopeptide repeat protein [Paludibacteraceae bacterium]MBQ9751310.1 tetratricopeptide repeat protein [Paludibacteraceae bacterium]MBR1995899.1 tetratricopeptide repeat protein [Paludibacteraceae bacterium]